MMKMMMTMTTKTIMRVDVDDDDEYDDDDDDDDDDDNDDGNDDDDDDGNDDDDDDDDDDNNDDDDVKMMMMGDLTDLRENLMTSTISMPPHSPHNHPCFMHEVFSSIFQCYTYR